MSTNNLGVLVVHMQENYRPSLQNKSNNIQAGLEKISHVLEVAMNNQTLIIIAEMIHSGKLLPAISSKLSPDKFELTSGDFGNCFAGDPNLAKTLRERGINRLILTGYDKYICVWYTAQGAIKNGFQLSTAEDLLFFTKESKSSTTKERVATADNLYHSNCKWYKSVDQLIAGEWGELK